MLYSLPFCSVALLLIVSEVQMCALVKSKPNWTNWPDDAKLISFLLHQLIRFPFLIMFPLFAISLCHYYFVLFFSSFLFSPAGIGRVILYGVFNYETRQMHVWHTQYYSLVLFLLVMELNFAIFRKLNCMPKHVGVTADCNIVYFESEF